MAQIKEGKILIQCSDGTLKPLKCDTSNYLSSLNSCINKRLLTINEGKNPLKCDICNFTCFYKNSLTKHVKSIHQKPLHSEFSDDSCLPISDQIKPLKSINEGKKPLYCDKCDFTCFYKGSMKKHVELQHKTTKTCNKRSQSKNDILYGTSENNSTLKSYMSKHTASFHDELKRFKCNKCDHRLV